MKWLNIIGQEIIEEGRWDPEVQEKNKPRRKQYIYIYI